MHPDLLTLQGEAAAPLMICVLGDFHLLKRSRPTPLTGARPRTLLAVLTLSPDASAPRDALLEALWPDAEHELAKRSLASLLYSLRRKLSDALSGEPPVLRTEDSYRLNLEAGVRTDVHEFDRLVYAGDVASRDRKEELAVRSYRAAVALYAGDVVTGSEIRAIVERERLRARYLTLLARLADHTYALGEYDASLEYVLRLLRSDACREDAHRLAMRCYLRRGERGQALRQFRLCEQMLAAEFGAVPEDATRRLFDQVRLSPETVE